MCCNDRGRSRRAHIRGDIVFDCGDFGCDFDDDVFEEDFGCGCGCRRRRRCGICGIFGFGRRRGGGCGCGRRERCC